MKEDELRLFVEQVDGTVSFDRKNPDVLKREKE
jgi:hypothetical protein